MQNLICYYSLWYSFLPVRFCRFRCLPRVSNLAPHPARLSESTREAIREELFREEFTNTKVNLEACQSLERGHVVSIDNLPEL
jgi:hypothetical protein